MSYSTDMRGWRDDGDSRAARNTARLLAAGVFVAVLGAVVAFSVYTVRNDDGSGGPRSGAVPEAASADGLGPVVGTDLGPYLETARGALATATGEQAAVVSFPGYKTEAEMKRILGDLPVVSMLVALPGRPPASTANLPGWINEQKASERAERDEIRKLIPTVDDPSFKKFYTEEVARLDKAIDSVPPNLIFAAVVRAPAPRLQALGSSPDVRMVDVARTRLAADAAYRGVRPEETAVAGEPSTRPL